MKKSYLLLTILSLYAGVLLAQKEYNIWYFCNKSGLNFNTNPVSVVNTNPMVSTEGSTTMCDSAGNLLFYSNGDGIYNRNNKVMLNYSNSRLYSLFSSSIQACIAVPHPGKKSFYYLFVTTSNENVFKFNDSFIYYYLIDMQGDNGLGEVVINEGKLMKSGVENIAVAQDSSKKELWVMTFDAFTNTLKFTKTTKGEISGNVVTHPINYTGQRQSNVRVSPDAKIFAGPISQQKISASVTQTTYHLYKFNSATGNLSNQIDLPIQGFWGYCFEFSPNSRFLYVNVINGMGCGLYQFDLSIWDANAILKSKVLVATFAYPFYGFQIGPDHRLYCFSYSNPNTPNALTVIQNPDLKGERCNFTANSIQLTSGTLITGGPLYPSYKFRSQVIDLGPDTILCDKDSIRLYSYARPGDKVQWNTRDTSAYLWVRQQGQYYVTLTSPDGFQQFGSITVRYGSKPKVYIGNDTTFCRNFSHQIKAQKYYKNYKWSTGDTVYSITANQAGVYSVLVKDSTNCASADTVQLFRVQKPEIKLSYDTIDCKYTYLSVKPVPNVYFVWNNKDTAPTFKAELKGRYIVNAHSPFCSSADTLDLNRLSRPDAQLRKDTFLCQDPIVLASKDSGRFLWSTGNTSPSIQVSKPGKYWVRVERNNCSNTDTINVLQDLPLFDLGKDLFVCEGKVWIGADVSGEYFWSTGDTAKKIQVDEGWYQLKIKRRHCVVFDSIRVNRLEKPVVDLGPDRMLCTNRLQLSSNTKGSYLWSTGATAPNLVVDQPGTYILTVSNGSCQDADTIDIKECQRLSFHIPSGFSPNGDGVNEVFRVEGKGIRSIRMQVFNRWGELLLDAEDSLAVWDGSFQYSPCQQDVYMYKIKIAGLRPEDVQYVFGTVTLMR